MNILSLSAVSKTLISKALFSDVSIGIEDNEHIGLVGKNGSGKSTFLRLLAGSLVPDTGTIAYMRGLRISVLQQKTLFKDGTTVKDFFNCDDYAPRTDQDEIENIKHSYISLCTEFGLVDALDSEMQNLSGGMQKKAALARSLSYNADLLLIDEPTNHIDLETIELLEQKLAALKTAFIVVSHDRFFLDTVVDRIIEIDNGSIFSYTGNYSDFLKIRQERWNAIQKKDSRLEAILKIELKWLNRGARARATKSERRKTGIKAIQNSLKNSAEPSPMAGFSSISRRLGKKIIELKMVTKQYDEKDVFKPFSYEFLPNDRIALVGRNGSGKTTLLRMIAGDIEPSSGIIDRGVNTVCSYYSQTAENLPMHMTMIDFISLRAELIKMSDGSNLNPRQLLERFSFNTDMHGQKLSTLSGGELRRLHLVSILAEQPNMLVLDEPSNDLDIETIELLEAYIDGFAGAVIVVSHDRAFIEICTNTTLHIDDTGSIVLYPQPFNEIRSILNKSIITEKNKTNIVVPEKKRAKKITWAERKEYETILDDIEHLENEKTSLENLFCDASVTHTKLQEAQSRYAEVNKLIEAKTNRWEYLTNIIEAAD